MHGRTYDLHGIRIFECPAQGMQLRDDRDAVALIGEASAHQSRFIVIPTARLSDDFFHLQTRIAGEILQKFVTYGVRVAILGSISGQLERSSALRDFVFECNRGPQVWFVESIEELDKRLQLSNSLS